MADDPTDPETEATDDGASNDADPTVDDTSTPADEDTEGKAKSKGPTADTAKSAAAGNVVRKKVVSKRVTPKGGPVNTKSGGAKSGGSKPQSKAAKAAAADDDEEIHSRRYTAPSSHEMLPSPWWVPALMFGLLILGAVIIMANYMGAFGDAENIRLVIGLAFILGGIITATQYR